MAHPKVLNIVGPTSSGKTSLSIALAQQFSGEVISADSRQVYRGLDLCSGKVTPKEMGDVPHHLLNVAGPAETYTVHDFTQAAAIAIADIHRRGNLPIIAGGTFLYTDTLLGRISVPAVPPNDALRNSLAELDTAALAARLQTLDSARYDTIDTHNRVRLIRAIEIATALGSVPTPSTATEPPYRALTLGITIDTDTLRRNIHERLLERLRDGMVAEVEAILAAGVTHDRLETLGLECRYLSRYLRGLLSYDDMVHTLETKIRQFAKRQYTWLKRDSSIQWVDKTDTDMITTLVSGFLTAE